MIEHKKSSAILVFNDAGELALQLRAAKVHRFPSHWDFSAGGGIEQGEDAKLSAQRELREELGMEANVEFITEQHYKYPAWKPNTIREVDLFIYKAHSNGPFKLDSIEVARVQFFKIETIGEMIKSGQKFHLEFIFAWNDGIILKAAQN